MARNLKFQKIVVTEMNTTLEHPLGN
ncbi:hypothetical protein NC651_026137 [Populus alba x Populus x berolinensis]|nr:hypothetical protein NC651_026137 [Populus alba x Populus x berolinensis]